MTGNGKSIMIQGTASSVGKSLLVAALCRVLYQDGYRVAPFKSQNMALNSFITEEGLEMGRAQVMQAEAAKIKPRIAMNPILLKPSTDQAAQVIIMGKAMEHMKAADYQKLKPQLKERVGDIFNEFSQEYDIVVIEGAGSPAEINLQEHDLVNMGMAEIADCPVILVGDIDRGGVFASIYGTVMLLPEAQRKRIKGVIINKFRGDIKILEPGLKMLEELIDIPVLGVIPYSHINLEDEDSVTERFNRGTRHEGQVKIEVVRLPHISNFTDFHIFDAYPEVSLRYVKEGEGFADPDIIILPGSKSTIADLNYLRKSGLDQEILKASREGKLIFGICGGFQMLGKTLYDPLGVEGSTEKINGLGLLDIETIFEPEKVTTQVNGKIEAQGLPFCQASQPISVKGYEIHMGRTTLGKGARPFITITESLGRPVHYQEGAVDENQQVFGTYLHGIFDEAEFTGQLITYLLQKKGLTAKVQKQISLEAYKEQEYEKLAEIFRRHVNMEKIYQLMEEQE